MATTCATGSIAGLGFTDADREENIRRVAEVSKLFLQSGIICLNSFITPKESFRELARSIIGAENLLEIYVECSFETCRKRDVKGLYKKAATGAVRQLHRQGIGLRTARQTRTSILNTETTPLERISRNSIFFCAWTYSHRALASLVPRHEFL